MTELEKPEPLRCPQCVAEGETSWVYELGGTSTLLYCQPFYDEQGRYHCHDFNTHRTQYECSRGHRFGKTGYGACWCGWAGDAS